MSLLSCAFAALNAPSFLSIALSARVLPCRIWRPRSRYSHERSFTASTAASVGDGEVLKIAAEPDADAARGLATARFIG